jgi:hypothetical protein
VTDQQEYERRRMAVANHILEHPEEFDMNTWGYQSACGTVACLAGTAVLQAAAEGLCQPVWPAHNSTTMAVKLVRRSGREGFAPVSHFARDHLGMTPAGAQLFHRYELDPEHAAKALLELPYVEERS